MQGDGQGDEPIPRPPSQQRPGSSGGPVPQPPQGLSDDAGASSAGGRRPSRSGYPPASVGLLRSSSQGSLRGPPDGDSSTLPALGRSSSSGGLARPPSGGRPGSADVLDPLLQGRPSSSSNPTPRTNGAAAGMGRSNSLTKLTPLPVSPALGPVGGSASGSPLSREDISLSGSPASSSFGNRGPSPQRPGSSGRPLAPLTPLGGGDGSRQGSQRGSNVSASLAVPPLDLHANRSSPGGGSTPSSTPGTGLPPPAPSDAMAAAIAARRKAAADRNSATLAPGEDPTTADTARGPIKWVPHTHANPKHAKFCFICLHGKLEGQIHGVDEEVVRQKQEDTDLPNPVDLKEMGYLYPNGSEFRRVGADFERDNISAEWLRSVNNEVYDEVVKGMVAEANLSMSQGLDEKLHDHGEDAKDRETLARLFTMSPEQQADVEKRLEKLGEWCEEQEARLVDVTPHAPPELSLGATLPEVPDPTPLQLSLMEYHPLVDASAFKGESANTAREALLLAEATISQTRKNGDFEGFKVDSLPKPATQPDMPDVEIVPYPVTVEDLPRYEPMEPLKPQRWPIAASPDPFTRPFLHVVNFHETAMPEFSSASRWGEPRPVPPQAAKMEWLWKTQSIFAAEKTADDAEYDWGPSNPRPRYMVPLIDQPYLPEPGVVIGDDGGKALVMRGIWDPELVAQDGKMVPPLRSRAKEMYRPMVFQHPDEPLWSKDLAPPKTRAGKIEEMINVIPVVSFSKFKPNRVSVDLPDFLWEIVRQDAAGQGLWDVIVQRHEIPQELRQERQEADDEIRRARQEEQEAIDAAVAAEAALTSGHVGGSGQWASFVASVGSPTVAGGGGEAHFPPMQDPTLLVGADVTRIPLVNDGGQMPALEIVAPDLPSLPPPPAAREAAEIADAAAASAAFEVHTASAVASAATSEVGAWPGSPAQQQLRQQQQQQQQQQMQQQTQQPQQAQPRPSIPVSVTTPGSPTSLVLGQQNSDGGSQGAVSHVSHPQSSLAARVPGAPKLSVLPLTDEAPTFNQFFPPSPSASIGGSRSPSMRLVPASLSARPASERGDARKVEDLLQDDRFLDTIADRIASRLGPFGGNNASEERVPSPLAAGNSFVSWRDSLATGQTTLTGQPTATLVRPSFVEPVDEQSRAKLPRALMGNTGARKQAASLEATRGASSKEPVSNSDISNMTQEKMRGDCYVRLLIAPEAHLARKEAVVYRGNAVDPDSTLVMKGAAKINTSMPKAPAHMNEDGEWEEDDEYAEFERNDSVIFSFVRHNRFEAVEALIAQENEILKAKDANGNTLLHIACQNNNRRIVKLLLKSGMEVNEQNKKGNTPLHYCSQYGFMQLADYLLAHGADDTIRNDSGLLPPQGLGTAVDDITGGQKTMQADLRQAR